MELALDRPLNPPSLPTSIVLRATAGVTVQALVATTLAGGAAVAAPLAGSTLYAVVQVAALTVPALLALQPLAGLAIRPEQTFAALLEGVREGGAMMLALAPVTLFLGMSTPGLTVAVAGYFACVVCASVAAVVVAVRRMVAAEPVALAWASTVACGWAAWAVVIAVPTSILAFDHLLDAYVDTFVGGAR